MASNAISNTMLPLSVLMEVCAELNTEELVAIQKAIESEESPSHGQIVLLDRLMRHVSYYVIGLYSGEYIPMMIKILAECINYSLRDTEAN